jgi:hypothetical protein
MAKEPTKPVTKSVGDGIQAILYRLGFDVIESLGDGLFDGCPQDVATLCGIEEHSGEIMLDVDVKCNTRIPLAALLRLVRREEEQDEIEKRLRVEFDVCVIP